MAFADSAVRCDRSKPYHRPRRATPCVTTGVAASIAAGDPNRMTTEQQTIPPDPHHGGRAWVRPVALVASCLVIGFVGGWVVRGDGGPVTVLSPAAPVDSGATGSVTAGSGTVSAPTGTSTAPGTSTATAPAAPAPPPDRADIALVVLNGTSTSGLAAKTAAQAESLGYSGVTAGNAPSSTSPSIAYFTPGQRAAAQRVAKDLQVGRVEALPATGALATATPDGTDVALVLGPG
jgi:hypothetical protein